MVSVAKALANLREKLIQYFDEEELRTLCVDLDVDYDSLPAKGKAAKARALVIYLHQCGRLAELVEECGRLRSNVAWNLPPKYGAAGTEQEEPIFRLPPVVMLFFNLVIVIVLACFVTRNVSLPWARCIYPEASALSLSILVCLLFHLAWRYFGSLVRDISVTMTLKGAEVVINAFSVLFDALHPAMLADRALWLLTVVLFVVVTLVGLSPLSPFSVSSEEAPIIHGFEVQYDGEALSLASGGVFQTQEGEQFLVSARLKQPDALCMWSSPKGSLQFAKGCAVFYSAPFGETTDILTLEAQSSCGARRTSASLQIKIVYP